MGFSIFLVGGVGVVGLEVPSFFHGHIRMVVGAWGGGIVEIAMGCVLVTSFNYENFEDLVDSFTSTQVNTMMIDVVNMDKQPFVMTKTIEALNKSIKPKDLQIVQLMSNLDLYFPRESCQNLIPH
ncbi:hypothetical protein H5410_048812 [Solanum commersonii]|uniref:Uncharacterized protein n=1 Tax=Solanum commersonii TaxID=4109 RepID=A0A9J5XKU4_SOLCO|nr:hypothetical protein H5410_048812 [Solanum commersonii]